MSDHENKKVDWYLFFDLLQVSKDILNLTENDNIIILIGDTPSYLAPFLEKERKVFHFAFSGKPFGCFLPPYASPSEWGEILPGYADDRKVDTFTPRIHFLNNYFDYLDKKTKLTRSFVKDNWKNIVLVDSSSGASIHGVSIFFNRYVGNIVQQEGDTKCTYTQGSEPLQFIQLFDGYYKALNLDPDLAEVIFPEKVSESIRNYRPDLIIHLGISVFYHRYQFVIADAYPRLVPVYFIIYWDTPPTEVKNDSFPMAMENIKTLKFLLQIYDHIKNKKTIDPETAKEILAEIKEIEPVYQGKTIDNLEEFLDDINMDLLYEKYQYYFNSLTELVN